MPSQYKTISGVRYEKELLDIADEVSSPITKARAARLWYAALDGNKVTDTEKKTLQYICKEYTIHKEAKAWLADKQKRYNKWVAWAAKRGGKAKGYKNVDGEDYDAALVEQASAILKTSSIIDSNGAEDLLDNALDGNGITKIEKQTLEYIVRAYKCNAAAVKLVRAAIKEFQKINAYAALLPTEDTESKTRPRPVCTMEPMDQSSPSMLSTRPASCGETNASTISTPNLSHAGAIVPVEAWARCLVRSCLTAQKPDVGELALNAKLKEIFDSIATSGDGRVSKIKLVNACRRDDQIIDFFGLSRSIQDNSSRDQMENILQAIEGSSYDIDWNEFQLFFHGKAPNPSGDPVVSVTGGTQARQLVTTRTEVLARITRIKEPVTDTRSLGVNVAGGIQASQHITTRTVVPDPITDEVRGGMWSCRTCDEINKPVRLACNNCGATRLEPRVAHLQDDPSASMTSSVKTPQHQSRNEGKRQAPESYDEPLRKRPMPSPQRTATTCLGSQETDLTPELQLLLSTFSDSMLAIESQEPEVEEITESPELLAAKAEAEAEISRILSSSKIADVLGGGSKEQQKVEFRRLVRLLHPDKSIVHRDDDRAILALRLVLAAYKKAVACN